MCEVYVIYYILLGISPEEVGDNLLVKHVESWVSHAGGETLKDAGDHFVLVLEVEVEAKDVAGEGVVHPVESAVAGVGVSFYHVAEHVQTLRRVKVDFLPGLVQQVARIDGAHYTELQGVDFLKSSFVITIVMSLQYRL